MGKQAMGSLSDLEETLKKERFRFRDADEGPAIRRNEENYIILGKGDEKPYGEITLRLLTSDDSTVLKSKENVFYSAVVSGYAYYARPDSKIATSRVKRAVPLICDMYDMSFEKRRQYPTDEMEPDYFRVTVEEGGIPAVVDALKRVTMAHYLLRKLQATEVVSLKMQLTEIAKEIAQEQLTEIAKEIAQKQKYRNKDNRKMPIISSKNK